MSNTGRTWRGLSPAGGPLRARYTGAVPRRPDAHVILTGIKLLHTVVWLFFVACIVAIPVTAGMGELGWAAVFSAVVLVECAVLALNRGRCPLTDLAARYTADRVDNSTCPCGWQGTTRRSSARSLSRARSMRRGAGWPSDIELAQGHARSSPLP